MSNLKIFFSFFIFITTLSFLTCENRPLFDEMAENRLKIVFKGTYASNNPRPWVTPTNHYDDLIEDVESVNDLDGSSATQDSLPTKLMIDIAELRLGKYKFANYRQVFTIPFNHTFFSGDDIDGGDVVLNNDDPTKGPFDTLSMYIRKMFFDSATQYERNGANFSHVANKPEAVFYENDVANIFDFNQRQIRAYYDTLKENERYVLRSFPLSIPIPGDLAFDKNEGSTVLEIRLILKNFIKKYETDFYYENIFNVIHYYAPSDYVNEVLADDYYIGGNLLAVARVYEESKKGEIVGTCSGCSGAGATYVIAIPDSEDIDDYKVKLSENRSSNPCNMPIYPNASLLNSFSDVSVHLEYLLRLEKYKYDWNVKRATCDTQTTFIDKWKLYKDTVKIPPLATWVDGSTYTIKNVQPGSYKVYKADTVPSYGKLFQSSDTFITASPTEVVTVPIGGQATANF
jgi:hypothetical protein